MTKKIPIETLWRGQKVKPIIKKTNMNKDEQIYAAHLQRQLNHGLILDFKFEAINLKLAKRTWYRPDFLVVTAHNFEFHEVKGVWRDDARVKIKVAAKEFSHFKFVAVQIKNKKLYYEIIGG